VEVRDPETSQYLPGNTTGGRTVGTKETFPRNAFKARSEAPVGTEGVQTGKVEVRDPETGQYLPGNTTGGRTVGTKETFPRNAFKAMAAIIEGRLREAQGDTPISEPMTQLLFDGIRGKIVISEGKHGTKYANPAIFLRALHEYMQKSRDRALKKAELAKKEKGATGGIRCCPRASTAPRSRAPRSS